MLPLVVNSFFFHFTNRIYKFDQFDLILQFIFTKVDSDTSIHSTRKQSLVIDGDGPSLKPCRPISLIGERFNTSLSLTLDEHIFLKWLCSNRGS